MVLSRKKVQRSQFRNVQFGQKYWLSSAVTATAPSVKYDRRNLLGGWVIATGRPALTAVADVSIAVIKVPHAFRAPAR